MTRKPIKEVLKEHAAGLMAIPGVHGVGEGLCDGEPCIKVFVSRDDWGRTAEIPEEIEGHRVKVETSGPFEAYT